MDEFLISDSENQMLAMMDRTIQFSGQARLSCTNNLEAGWCRLYTLLDNVSHTNSLEHNMAVEMSSIPSATQNPGFVRPATGSSQAQAPAGDAVSICQYRTDLICT